MIPCKHCNTPNSLDSTFCKRCGTGLPEDEVTAGKAKLEKIVEEGNLALSQGRLEEASAIALTAVSSDPSMSAAHSLKSAVHERRGEIAEALESAERVVELNPDSELDKIKRNQLRAALGASAANHQPANKGVAFVAALSAAAIVLCSAIWVGKWISQRPYDSRVAYSAIPKNPAALAPPVQNPETPSSVPAAQNVIAPAAQTQPTQPAPVEGPHVKALAASGGQDSSNDQNPTPPSRARSNDMGTLPDTSDQLDLNPMTPPAPATMNTNAASPRRTQAPPQNSSRQATSDPSPTPESNPQKQTPVDQGPGQIEISVHHDGPSPRHSQGGAQEAPKDSGAMFMKMGNDYYQMGNYSGAASSLEKAVTNGADPVRANMRLAQSYTSLGKRAEAAEAYKRTIAAASTSLNSGRGDSAKLKAVRDAAEAALHQIQGG